MGARSLAAAGGLALAGAAGCECTPSFRECDAVNPEHLAAMPSTLQETGLFEPATSVRPYRPRFELWTDGATKRRWIALPEGGTIDTSRMDAWNFPVGTRFWKEFARDGIVIETRMLLKHGEAADAWTPMAYLHDGGRDAVAVPGGAVDAGGTSHDVPDAASCMGCHGGTPSGILGFSMVQLPHEGRDGDLGIADLALEGRLSHPPSKPLVIPGDDETVEALGYLHANCSHCHNGARPARAGARCFDPQSELDLMLRPGELDRLEATAAYRTGVGTFIQPGDAEGSEVIVRARSRDPWWGMPALGTERVDESGVAVLETWIEQLD